MKLAAKICILHGVSMLSGINSTAQWNEAPGINNLFFEMDELRYHLTASPDGADGIILFWSDRREAPIDLGQVYGQHINAAGIRVWEDTARVFCDAQNRQTDTRSVTDGQGGAYLVWRDNRTATGSLTRMRIYGQHINAGGEATWQENGVDLGGGLIGQGVLPQLEEHTYVCHDGNGGMIVAWSEVGEDDVHCFAQRIDVDGNMLWNEGTPLPVYTEESSASYPNIVADGEGGAYIMFRISQAVNETLRVYRINAEGELVFGGGGFVSVPSNAANVHIAATDPEQNLLIAWKENAGGNVKAQLIGHDGELLWDANGVNITAPGVPGEDIRVATDAFGYYISYCKDADSPFANAHAQKLDANGNLIWGPEGVQLLSSLVRHHVTSVHPDTYGGSITTFTQLRILDVSPPTLYAANIRSDGMPNGELHLINDTELEQLGSGKLYQNTIGISDNLFITSWIENRASTPPGSRQIYGAKFGFGPYTITNSNDESAPADLLIYPNPTAESFTVVYQVRPNATAKVYDMQGKIHQSHQLQSSRTVIETSGWSSGIYQVVVDDGNKIVSRRLVVL